MVQKIILLFQDLKIKPFLIDCIMQEKLLAKNKRPSKFKKQLQKKSLIYLMMKMKMKLMKIMMKTIKKITAVKINTMLLKLFFKGNSLKLQLEQHLLSMQVAVIVALTLRLFHKSQIMFSKITTLIQLLKTNLKQQKKKKHSNKQKKFLKSMAISSSKFLIIALVNQEMCKTVEMMSHYKLMNFLNF